MDTLQGYRVSKFAVVKEFAPCELPPRYGSVDIDTVVCKSLGTIFKKAPFLKTSMRFEAVQASVWENISKNILSKILSIKYYL